MHVIYFFSPRSAAGTQRNKGQYAELQRLVSVDSGIKDALTAVWALFDSHELQPLAAAWAANLRVAAAAQVPAIAASLLAWRLRKSAVAEHIGLHFRGAFPHTYRGWGALLHRAIEWASFGNDGALRVSVCVWCFVCLFTCLFVC